MPAPTPETNRTVYIVDDDADARASLAALISSNQHSALQFASGEEFLAALPANARGCVVLDVRMTGMSGLDVQAELKRRECPLPVIVITGYADVPMAVRAMKQGALTFLEKPCANQELWKNIESALNHERELNTLRERKSQLQADYDTLTPGEIQVLEKLLEGKPNKSIAVELDIGLRTVEMRRAVILKKMQVESLAQLVRVILTLRGL